MQERDGAALVLDRIRNRFPWLQLVWADAGFDAHQVKATVAKLPVLQMEIVRRSDYTKGFKVQPRRWNDERIFSWLSRNRRLGKDYENLASTIAAFVSIASIRLALKRLAGLA